MIRTAAVFLVLAATARAASGQSEVSFVPFEGLARDIRRETGPSEGRAAEIADLLQTHTQELALYALGPLVYSSLVEEGRIDKQVGTSSSASGSTTLVSRGSVPALIGLAVESGALYQSVSGNVVTFRVNPSGLARALVKKSYLLSAPPLNAAALETELNKFSGSASFDFQQGASPGTFTGERSQLKEAAVRYDAMNKRDPRHPSHAGAVQELRASLSGLVGIVQAYFDALKKMPGYDQWRVSAAAALAAVDAGNSAALKAALVRAGDEFTAAFAATPDMQRLGRTLVDEIQGYREIRDKVFQRIAKSSILTVEYAFNRMTLPAEARPDPPVDALGLGLSTGRVIFSSPLGAVGEATVNGSVTFFNSTRAEMRGSFRDAQIAGSVEFKLPEIQSVGRMVLTVAGLGVFLHQQPFGVRVRVRDVETDDGAIGVFQAKLTVPAGRSGAQIPVSFTVANRSEFNTENEVRGSVGLTFDLDKLFVR
jgi:hypothetical protein